MYAHERQVTVTEAGQITISGLPVHPGQRVRVTVSMEDTTRERLAAAFQATMKRTQELPQVQPLTDAEIASEIARHRRDRGAA